MRIALITPHYQRTARGNAVTVRRIERQLQKLGCTVAVFSPESASTAAIVTGVNSFAPDVIHAFHAVHCGELAAVAAARTRLPYVVTMTGTDIYASAEDTLRARLIAAMSGAAALVFFADQVRQGFVRAHPELSVPTLVIPQGVNIPDRVSPEPADNSACNFLLPAGVRPVKNLLFPFPPLARLWQRHPQTRFILAGGILDADFAARLSTAVSVNPFAHWLGEVAFEGMAALYDSAHVVVNSSFSEGGMANSLLEGMAHGRALLAADIEGNSTLVRNGENGFLYQDADDFFAKAELLLLDRDLRCRMGSAGRDYVCAHCSPAVEAGRYLQLYAACGR